MKIKLAETPREEWISIEFNFLYSAWHAHFSMDDLSQTQQASIDQGNEEVEAVMNSTFSADQYVSGYRNALNGDPGKILYDPEITLSQELSVMIQTIDTNVGRILSGEIDSLNIDTPDIFNKFVDFHVLFGGLENSYSNFDFSPGLSNSLWLFRSPYNARFPRSIILDDVQEEITRREEKIKSYLMTRYDIGDEINETSDSWRIIDGELHYDNAVADDFEEGVVDKLMNEDAHASAILSSLNLFNSTEPIDGGWERVETRVIFAEEGAVEGLIRRVTDADDIRAVQDILEIGQGAVLTDLRLNTGSTLDNATWVIVGNQIYFLLSESGLSQEDIVDQVTEITGHDERAYDRLSTGGFLRDDVDSGGGPDFDHQVNLSVLFNGLDTDLIADEFRSQVLIIIQREEEAITEFVSSNLSQNFDHHDGVFRFTLNPMNDDTRADGAKRALRVMNAHAESEIIALLSGISVSPHSAFNWKHVETEIILRPINDVLDMLYNHDEGRSIVTAERTLCRDMLRERNSRAIDYLSQACGNDIDNPQWIVHEESLYIPDGSRLRSVDDFGDILVRIANADGEAKRSFRGMGVRFADDVDEDRGMETHEYPGLFSNPMRMNIVNRNGSSLSGDSRDEVERIRNLYSPRAADILQLLSGSGSGTVYSIASASSRVSFDKDMLTDLQIKTVHELLKTLDDSVRADIISNLDVIVRRSAVSHDLDFDFLFRDANFLIDMSNTHSDIYRERNIVTMEDGSGIPNSADNIHEIQWRLRSVNDRASSWLDSHFPENSFIFEMGEGYGTLYVDLNILQPNLLMSLYDGLTMADNDLRSRLGQAPGFGVFPTSRFTDREDRDEVTTEEEVSDIDREVWLEFDFLFRPFEHFQQFVELTDNGLPVSTDDDMMNRLEDIVRPIMDAANDYVAVNVDDEAYRYDAGELVVLEERDHQLGLSPTDLDMLRTNLENLDRSVVQAIESDPIFQLHDVEPTTFDSEQEFSFDFLFNTPQIYTSNGLVKLFNGNPVRTTVGNFGLLTNIVRRKVILARTYLDRVIGFDAYRIHFMPVLAPRSGFLFIDSDQVSEEEIEEVEDALRQLDKDAGEEINRHSRFRVESFEKEEIKLQALFQDPSGLFNNIGYDDQGSITTLRPGGPWASPSSVFRELSRYNSLARDFLENEIKDKWKLEDTEFSAGLYFKENIDPADRERVVKALNKMDIEAISFLNSDDSYNITDEMKEKVESVSGEWEELITKVLFKTREYLDRSLNYENDAEKSISISEQDMDDIVKILQDHYEDLVIPKWRHRLSDGNTTFESPHFKIDLGSDQSFYLRSGNDDERARIIDLGKLAMVEIYGMKRVLFTDTISEQNNWSDEFGESIEKLSALDDFSWIGEFLSDEDRERLSELMFRRRDYFIAGAHDEKIEMIRDKISKIGGPVGYSTTYSRLSDKIESNRKIYKEFKSVADKNDLSVPEFRSKAIYENTISMNNKNAILTNKVYEEAAYNSGPYKNDYDGTAESFVLYLVFDILISIKDRYEDEEFSEIVDLVKFNEDIFDQFGDPFGPIKSGLVKGFIPNTKKFIERCPTIESSFDTTVYRDIRISMAKIIRNVIKNKGSE